MAHLSEGLGPAEVTVVAIDESDVLHVLEAYSLLQEVLGTENVEDIDSFWGTVSSSTDDAVVPRLVCAVYGRRIQGVTVGAYLRNLNMGMVLYSAVREAVRGRGIYATLRARLLALLNSQAGHRRDEAFRSIRNHSEMEYLITELEDGSRLLDTYQQRWGAFVAPCQYEQPAAQGLPARKLSLLLQPMARKTPPTRDETAIIVREIYEQVYRLPDVGHNPHFRRIVESLGERTGTFSQELR